MSGGTGSSKAIMAGSAFTDCTLYIDIYGTSTYFNSCTVAHAAHMSELDTLFS